MRAFAIILIFLAVTSSLWLGGCSTTSGGGTAERIIQAEPAQIVENVGREFQAGGMDLISRSDRGDIYETELSAEALRDHATLAQLAEHGNMTLRARVSRTEIEFTSRFPDTETVVGFMINLSPAPQGDGTLARMEPILRTGGGESDQRMAEGLRRSFSRHGERMLESIVRSAEG